MPTVLRIGPYSFRFYASDIDEPPHVHVKRDRAEAKFWLQPVVRLEWQRGFNQHELNVVRQLVEEHRVFLLEKWREYFGRR
ncbi:MAG TPA: DUF4160 domain-containing protein [Tepidisphaeraceae bacterium]|jgi:hypothetical protein|nr:DUF4160 domain-containing protein [Tepidisphaeraceae bacterium]